MVLSKLQLVGKVCQLKNRWVHSLFDCYFSLSFFCKHVGFQGAEWIDAVTMDAYRSHEPKNLRVIIKKQVLTTFKNAQKNEDENKRLKKEIEKLRIQLKAQDVELQKNAIDVEAQDLELRRNAIDVEDE